MYKTAKQIRRAFENITPNVLDRVLSQSVCEKGAVIPMTEKKPFIPFALQRVASMAAMVVLLIAIGTVALMILNGRTNPQLSENPTEPPTEAPVNIDLENLKLNATKLDKNGNEIGTTEITIHVTKGEENEITDIQIDPFDGWEGHTLPVDSTTGMKFEIRQIGVHATGKVNMATLSGFATDNLYYFCTLYFTDDFEHLIFDIPTNADGNYYYVAAAGNNLTAKEIIGCFEDIGVTLFPMDPSEFYPTMNLTQEEFEQYLSAATEYEIWQFSQDATETLTLTVNGKTRSYEMRKKVYSTSEKADLDAMRNSFADWTLTDNRVSYMETILSISDAYLIVFDNGLVIGTIENFDREDSGDVRVKGYGEVNRTRFFLPDAFCELLRSKVGS